MREWLKRAVLKTARAQALVGSNPTPSATMHSIIYRWHTALNMPKYDAAWHEQDIKDECAELEAAHGLIETWSELSDVVYTYTRAQWSGHEHISFPLSRFHFFIGLLYMFPKYTLRWHFFRTLGKNIDPELVISEVRNPKKAHKLDGIAQKYNIDPELFKNEAQRLMRRRLFLK